MRNVDERKLVSGVLVSVIALIMVVSATSSILSETTTSLAPTGEEFVRLLVDNPENIHFLENAGIEIIEEYDSFVLAKIPVSIHKELERSGIEVVSMPDLNKIMINDYVFNVNEEPNIPVNLKRESYQMGHGQYLLKLIGPIKQEWKRTLEENGVRIYGYIPNYAFIVEMDDAIKAKILDLPFVEGIAMHHPAYRIQPLLLDKEGIVEITIHGFLPNWQRYAMCVQKLGGEVMSNSIGPMVASTPMGAFVTARIDGKYLPMLAQVPDIRWIEPYSQPATMNDDYVQVVQSGTHTGGTPIWDEGIDGTGQIITIADTGLDYDHELFRDLTNPIGPDHRKIIAYVDIPKILNPVEDCVGFWQDGTDDSNFIGYDPKVGWRYDSCASHGTHVAGTAAGNNINNTGHDGVANGAKLYFQDIGHIDWDTTGSSNPNGWPGYYDSLRGIPNDYHPLFAMAKENNSYIHSNSWGIHYRDEFAGLYNTGCSQTDDFMFYNQDVLIIFSQGNDGTEGAMSVTPYATAKNVVSAGGIREDSYYDDVWADSSRGPTKDGRMKPTVLTPATTHSAEGEKGPNAKNCRHVINAPAFDGNMYYADNSTQNSNIIRLSGTSMSAPGVAGCAALIRQYFEEGWYPTGTQVAGNGFAPSGALLKAVLVNCAQETTGANADRNGEGKYPNNSQGWGRVLLDNSLYFVSEAGGTTDLDRKLKIVEHKGLLTGDSATYEYKVTSTNMDFEVTLVWSDYRGEEGASIELVNDLDLKVTSPTGTVYKGNVFAGLDPGQSTTGGVYDTKNVVEGVLRIDGGGLETGVWTVEVTASNVVFGPQPFALAVAGDLDLSYGSLQIDKQVYGESDTIKIRIEDTGESVSVNIDVSSSSETTPETVTLTEIGDGIFEGTINTAFGENKTDGLLQVADNDQITVKYSDSSPSHTVYANASVDASGQAITNVKVVDIKNSIARINWETDEPSDSTVKFWESGTADYKYGHVSDLTTTQHSVPLISLKSNTLYYFDISSEDGYGHNITSDNGGDHYSFSTISDPVIFLIVDDDEVTDSGNYVDDWGYCLEGKGWSYIAWEVINQGFPSLNDLRSAKAVIYDTAQGYPQLGTQERELLQAYFENGTIYGGPARLFLTGNDIGWDMNNCTDSKGTDPDDEWYHTYLLANYYADDASGSSDGVEQGDMRVIGIDGDPITDPWDTEGTSNALDATVFGENRFWPDDISYNGSIMCWDYINLGSGANHSGGGNCAGIRADESLTYAKSGEEYRIVYEAWGHQMMGSTVWPSPGMDEDRAQKLNRSLIWLIGNSPPKVSVTNPNGGTTESGDVTITWSASDPDIAQTLTVKIEYSPDNGQSWFEINGGSYSTANDGTEVWHTSGLLNGVQYMVKITVADDGTPSTSQFDESNSIFTVDNGASGDIKGPLTVPGSVKTEPNPVWADNTTWFNATIDDSTKGNANIDSTTPAEFFVDTIGTSGTGTPMTLVSSPTSPTEDVTWNGPATWGGGNHTLYVHGLDAYGNWGAFESSKFVIFGGGDTFELNFAAGLNLISLPLNVTDPTPSGPPQGPYFSAQDLINSINADAGSSVAVYKWDGAWYSFYDGDPASLDFEIKAWDGYFVKCTSSSIWMVKGTLVPYKPVPLSIGLNLIGASKNLSLNDPTPSEPPQGPYYSAQDLINSINNQLGAGAAVAVYKWNAAWYSFYDGDPASLDFEIERGAGYFVKCTIAGNWTPP
jgi:hypothetical protein